MVNGMVMEPKNIVGVKSASNKRKRSLIEIFVSRGYFAGVVTFSTNQLPSMWKHSVDILENHHGISFPGIVGTIAFHHINAFIVEEDHILDIHFVRGVLLFLKTNFCRIRHKISNMYITS